MSEPSLKQERLRRFYPTLLILSVLAAGVQGTAAAMLREPGLAAAAGLTALFAAGVTVARRQIRAGRPFRARVALAASLAFCAALGAYLVPGVGPSLSLLPVVSVVLVLPHVQSNRFIPLLIAAATSGVIILALEDLGNQLPAIADPVGTIYQQGILVGVLVLVLAGVADFALEARHALSDLHESTERQIRVTTARLSIVASLQNMRELLTPEATADEIAKALADLPLVAVAVVFEVTDDGLSVLGVASHEPYPIYLGDILPRARAKYLLERSGQGTWAELWVDRPGPGLEDERLSQLGIQGQAFAPILACDELVGLASIATTDLDQAVHLVADLPSVSEAAATAGAILAPALLARRRLRSARVRVAETLASGGFHAVFQPIVDLQTGLTVGYEALTRFATGDAPDEIFAVAARAGLGIELEEATLTAAVRDAARLPPGVWLSLNVSPTLLAECARLTAILSHRTRPIILEITEHEIVDEYAPLHEALAQLGPDVSLAVDDAGAGVANFRHLVDLRPGLIKIDAGLIRGANADVSRQAVIVGLVHFAAVSGARVLAEGLETDAELEIVQRLGVTLGQGYRLARPAPIEEWAVVKRRIGTAQPVLADVIPIRRVTNAG